MTRAAIYTRISDDREGLALGVQRQEADCRALATRLGYADVDIYADNDVSAFSGKPRPQYRRLLADVRDRKVSAVIAYAPDRLYRRLADLAEFVDTVRLAGCAVHTVSAGQVDLSTAAGRTMAVILGGVAIGESERQGERIKRKLAERTSQGLPHGGHRPYGWETDRMTIRESEAQWIRWGVKQTLGGVPIRTQFQELNDRGVTTSIGRAWNHATWRGVLTTARHAGLMPDGRTEASWPAIISPEEYRAVVRLLNDPKRVTTPGRGGKLHLLSGIARCGFPGCDGMMRVGKSKGGPTVYRCYPSGHVQRSQEHIDYMARQAVARMLREKGRGLLAEAGQTEAAEKRKKAEAEAARLRLLIDDAAAEHGRLGLPLSALAAYTAPLREQLTAAEAAAEEPRDRKAVLGGVLGADDPGDAFLALSTDRQRPIVDMLLEIRVGRGPRGNVFRPDGITMEWR